MPPGGATLGATAILLAYLATVTLTGIAIRDEGELGIDLEPCGAHLCVAWVMPAGHAWHDGARPGMRVISLNGQDAWIAVNRVTWRTAELLAPDGHHRPVRATEGAITRPGARLLLWLTGGVFALLGAAVLSRRPDAVQARLFAVFSGVTAVAFGVSPAAGGPHPPWALILQFVSFLGIAGSLPAFAASFVGRQSRWRIPLRFFWLAGGLLLAGYAVALIVRPVFYAPVRIGFALYLLAGIVTALVILTAEALSRRRRPSVRDARLALAGIALGTLPFVGLTLLPHAAVQEGIVPSHVSATFWGVIPATFSYAILRHKTLGIRRLVHRGMVYGVATLGLFVIMFSLILAAGPLITRLFGAIDPALLAAALLGVGALLFHLLSRFTRRFLHRFLDSGDIDSESLLAGMREDLIGSESAEEVVDAMVTRLRDVLQLEAIALFLGATNGSMRVAARAGPRAEETIDWARPRLPGLASCPPGLSELRWRSDVLLIARLETASGPLGYLMAGPKEKGEVFLRDERRLIEVVTPVLALAIRQTTLISELRDVSERLTNAQEAERARLARDLHDGPLQKAILLGGSDVILRDRDGVARDLASELRELCSRLRPAILDDLGLVPAIEWLLEQTAQGFPVTPRLSLRGMSEEDRLAPNTELALFRVTQEAVTNALKHGHAMSIHVSLTRTHDGVHLSVTDDGSGLPGDGPAPRGLGIPGMRERLRQIGGSFSVASDGRGTMVTARVPHADHHVQ